MNSHASMILDQFTRQAVPFSKSGPMSDAASLQMLVDLSGAGPASTVLDVACGPGLVVSAFAKSAKQVAGIDLVPAMIQRAQVICREQGLSNVRFDVGDVTRLPYPDATYTHVVSRFAFHHMPDPLPVLREMARCCEPGGRVLLVDAVAPEDPAKAAAWNWVETLRDPSHVDFRPVEQLLGWIGAAGLTPLQSVAFPVNLELEAVLKGSFPKEGDVDRMRKAFEDALPTDAFGVGLHRDGDKMRYSIPCVALLAQRPK